MPTIATKPPPCEAMLALSRELNPQCEHLAGDLRALRLGRGFDAVLVHDAVMYMTTEDDLLAAAHTAFAHTRPGGAAVFAPDCVRETFRESKGQDVKSVHDRHVEGVFATATWRRVLASVGYRVETFERPVDDEGDVDEVFLCCRPIDEDSFGRRTHAAHRQHPRFGLLEALATDRVLEDGMPVILDAAPVYQGYTVDTSYAFAFGENRLQRELVLALAPLRHLILRRVRERLSLLAIAGEVDEEIRAQGYENCHRKHIGAVLAHRVTLVPDGWINRRRVWGLGAQQVTWFLAKSFAAERGGGDGSPNWNHRRSSDHPPTPGLWAVEPHLGCRSVGAKFEEILVVTDQDAWWLDEEGLPHHAVWRMESTPAR